MSEESIPHAVIAIGALNITPIAQRIPKPQGGSNSSPEAQSAFEHYQFALQQYNKAIALYERDSRAWHPVPENYSPGMYADRMLETYHGNHRAALSQMQVGLRLMDGRLGCPLHPPIFSSSRKEVIEEGICEAFDRLDIPGHGFSRYTFSIHPPGNDELPPRCRERYATDIHYDQSGSVLCRRNHKTIDEFSHILC